jgi:hypothetical protein
MATVVYKPFSFWRMEVMKELFNSVLVKASDVRLTKEQVQLIIVLVIVLLLVLGSGAPSTFSGWGGG